MKKIFRWITTVGGVGHLPAPGTCATAITAFMVWGMYPGIQVDLAVFGALWFVFAGVAYGIITQALKLFPATERDPSEIVLDEVVGFLLVFCCFPLKNSTVATLLMAFGIFRFFDIVKPFGIKKSELLPGAGGILVDDCIAGLLTSVVLYLFLWIGIL